MSRWVKYASQEVYGPFEFHDSAWERKLSTRPEMVMELVQRVYKRKGQRTRWFVYVQDWSRSSTAPRNVAEAKVWASGQVRQLLEQLARKA